MSYDLFISYSRKDNRNHRITELKDRIAADYLAFSGEELRCFFDLDDIHGMDDWRHRILEGLRESSLLLLVLSPGYLASEYCEWEIVEYLKYEHSRAAAGQGVAPVYFVEVPGLDTPGFEQEAAAWVARVRRRNHFDLRPWHDEGVEALKREDVRARLKALEETLHASIAKMRRIANAPGNLASHNPHFVGRETEMLRLHEAAGLGRFGVLTALQGMGGLGKTALAIQYAYAYADFYPGGRWLVGCAGKTSLAAIIRELDADLGITFTDEEKGDDTRAARRVLAELETRARNGAAARAGEKDPPQPRTLLLLDNVDEPTLLQTPQADLISGKRWLHVIATTRLANDELGHDPDHQTLLAVDELPLEDAVRLIESNQPGGSFPNDAERAAAHDLAALLGGFTLAVEVVAVHLGERLGQITCAAFRDRLQREGLGGLEVAAKATRSAVSHRQKLIGATLGPTLDLLGPEESLVLAYAALLPPDTIPLPWLRALVAKEYPNLGKDAEPGYDDPWLDLVNHLLGLRLFQVVDVDPDTRAPRLVRMHRLVAELVRERIGPVAIAIRQEALTALVRQRAAVLAETTLWQDARWELAPFEALAWLWAEPAPADDSTARANAAWLLNQAGVRRYHLAEWSLAESLYRRALAIDEASFGPEHPVIARDLNDLAQLLGATNRFAEAEPLMRRALDIAEASVGPNHPDVALTLNNLSELLKATNRHDEAEPLKRRALDIDEASFGSDHPQVALKINNLALLLKDTNRLTEAEPLMRRALAIDEASFGSEHPVIARDLNNLAQLLQATNRFAEAEPLMRRALEIAEASLGPNHPDVALKLNNLSGLLKATNRYDEAEPLKRRALDIDEASFGSDHPDVARDLNNLARLLQDTNRLAEAEPLMRRALAIFEASFGVNHPNVATTLSNLALLLQATNRLAEAESLYRRALAIDEASFGPEHLNVATRLSNLARLLQATNRLAEAEPLMRRSLGIKAASLGARHPEVGNGLASLALILFDMGMEEEARNVAREALPIWEQSETPNDPRAGKAHLVLGLVAVRRNKADAAKEFLQRALKLLSQNRVTYSRELAQTQAALDTLA